MRSCALRILLAATIFMALVIFCVLLKLAILTRISLMPGMGLVRAGSRELFAQLLETRLDVLAELGLRVDAVHQRLVVRLRERLQARFVGADFVQRHLV